jgi:hypothetical protein
VLYGAEKHQWPAVTPHINRPVHCKLQAGAKALVSCGERARGGRGKPPAARVLKEAILRTSFGVRWRGPVWHDGGDWLLAGALAARLHLAGTWTWTWALDPI